MAAKGMDAVIEQLAELSGVVGRIDERTLDTQKDVAEVRALQKTQNGNVADIQRAVTLARAWRENHDKEHIEAEVEADKAKQEVANKKRDTTQNRIEIFKSAPPYLTWALNLVVIVLLLTGVNVPTAVARMVDSPVVPVVEPSPHPAPVFAPTATATPRPSPSPKATEEPKAGDEDRAALSRLCWVEARGEGKLKADACLSVISTVLIRAERELMSDGSVFGTLVYNCNPGDLECAFPAYTAHPGCEGLMLTHCPDNSPSELAYFVAVVDAFFDGGMRGKCQHYLYYGSRPIDRPECVVGGLKFFEKKK